MRPLALTTLFLLGCADGRSVLSVTVGSTGTVDAIDHLGVQVSVASKSAKPVTVAVTSGVIPPAVKFALVFPSTIRGSAHVVISAVAGGGGERSHVEGDVDIKPSGSFSLTLELPGAGSADLGGLDAATPDAAAPDLAGGDLSRSALPATQLAFTVPPADTSFGYAITPAVQVSLLDVNGQLTTATDAVSLTLGTAPSPSPAPRLTGTLTAAAVNGVASFADLRIDAAGSYTLSASAAGLSGATSAPFTVSAPSFAPATAGIFGGPVVALAAGKGPPTVLYAAGGEVNGGPPTSGVFRSDNAGGTWVPINNGLTSRVVKALAVDPTNNQIAYAGTDQGIFKTSDSGAHWSLSYSQANKTWVSLAIDPAAHQTVYAGAFDVMVYTTNAGTAWMDDSTGLTTNGLGGQDCEPIRGIAVNGSTLYIACYHGGLMTQTVGGTWTNIASVASGYANAVALAGTAIFVGVDGGLWWNGGSGLTFSQVPSASPNFFKPTAVGSIVVDPTNSMKIYAGSRDTATQKGGVHYTTDGGATWEYGNGGIDGDAVNTMVLDPTTPSTAYVAIGRGVFKSTTATGSWAASNGGLTALPITSLSPTATSIYAGTRYGGVWKTTDRGLDWGPANGAGGTALPAFDTSAFNLLVGIDTDLYAAGVGLGVSRSTDGAGTWTNFASPAGLTDSQVYSLARSPQNPMLLYAGGSNALFKTTNSGAAWTDGNLTGDTLTGLAFHPTSATTLWAATNSGKVWSTINGGTMWNDVSTGLPAAAIESLARDGVDAMTLYASVPQHGVYRTTDGAIWSSASAGLPGDLKIHQLAAHPTQSGVLLLATESGVYRTTDGGGLWSAITGGLDDLSVQSVAFDALDPATLWAGTSGGGVHKTP